MFFVNALFCRQPNSMAVCNTGLFVFHSLCVFMRELFAVQLKRRQLYFYFPCHGLRALMEKNNNNNSDIVLFPCGVVPKGLLTFLGTL